MKHMYVTDTSKSYQGLHISKVPQKICDLIHFVHSPHQGNLQYPISTPSFKYHHHHFSFSYIYTHNSLITFPVTMFSFPLIYSLIQVHNCFNGMTISVHKINKFYETQIQLFCKIMNISCTQTTPVFF